VKVKAVRRVRRLIGFTLWVVVLALVPAAAVASTASTIRVSVSSSGVQSDQASYTPGRDANSAVSATGRFTAFTSSATNLTRGDTNAGYDVFVYDRSTGKTRRVSVSSSGAEGNAPSFSPSISADGRYVAFASTARNLVHGDTNGVVDVFVRDRWAHQTQRVSISSSGAQANAVSTEASISADGNHVAFASAASNLVAQDSNAKFDIFVRDRSAERTRRVSLSSSGEQANAASHLPSISYDGNVVAFNSFATNLANEDTNGVLDGFVREREAKQTRRVSISSSGEQANAATAFAAVSASGRFVAFQSAATNLVGADSNGGIVDVFIRDRSARQTELVSVSSEGIEGNHPSYLPAISADGRYVAFQSFASNLVEDDTNALSDVFVRDRSAGATRRASVGFDGTQATGGQSFFVEIAGTGCLVAFTSEATNLVDGDTNGVADVFVRRPLC
jgi:Tol biopolymer transport system component